MTKPYLPPSGKISTKQRDFKDVVRDIRHAIAMIVRFRPIPNSNNQYNVTTLASGFFVSPEIFLTCNHVVNDPNAPHQDGDMYQLVSRTHDNGGQIVSVPKVVLTQNLFLYPDCDLALLRCPPAPNRPYVALEYGEVMPGEDIGVAGYPACQLTQDANGNIVYDGAFFRVARGVVTSRYRTTINMESGGTPITNVPILEVNFLFVPGNSGGPVFDVEKGRVFGFVHGYTAKKLREKVEQITLIQNPPPGIGPSYVENLNAIYSLAIKLDHVRVHLEANGVTL